MLTLNGDTGVDKHESTLSILHSQQPAATPDWLEDELPGAEGKGWRSRRGGDSPRRGGTGRKV